ncbi:TIGR01777 family oxidoreductase [uncultured Jatrophihabitans sp.]|uniref:TIGR01777 family oxidoreductase n=1 Tax=uncultured Jatrophihabitans sp. TaxID=1610747 RepID=UPI0035C95E4E
MLLLLAGASGLLGPALRDDLLADGHTVRTLVRREPSGPDEHRWDPAAGVLDPSVLDGVDVVVCLSGAGVGDRRWTASYKKTILQSRVDSVGTLATAMAGAGSSGKLVCASAVGYYGDTGDRRVDESTPPGDGFLADVCVQWERAADPARAAGITVSHLRTGLVLAKKGGLLPRLGLIVKLGIGGRLGSGRQYFPWISVTDEVAAMRFVIENDVPGAANLTAPNPVTNAEFTKTLGGLLHRPTILPVPGFAARIALGEFAGDVLTGQNAVPAALQDAGFTFTHPDLTSALESELR